LQLERLQFGFIPGLAIRVITRLGPSRLIRTFARATESLLTDRPTFIFRVDDYPRWDVDSSEFFAFDDVFRELDVPYVLGVTPWCEFWEGQAHWITNDESDYLRELVSGRRVALGLHGFTHRPRFVRSYVTEVAGQSESELRAKLRAAESWFIERRLPYPHVFIPPFDTLTRENFRTLRESFEVITAGPSALSSFGPYPPQVYEGTLYLPSYRPLTGLSSSVSRGLRVIIGLSQLHAITLHWEWERRVGYRALKELLSRVKSVAEIWTLNQAIDHFSARRSLASEVGPGS